jgi:hypothetical protein
VVGSDVDAEGALVDRCLPLGGLLCAALVAREHLLAFVEESVHCGVVDW